MGLFDSFMLTVSCPHCGEVSEVEFQTKQFACAMIVWKTGDKFDTPGLTINHGTINGVYGGCNSKKCNAWQKKRDGYSSGFGRRIYCDVIIEHSRVLAALNVRKEE